MITVAPVMVLWSGFTLLLAIILPRQWQVPMVVLATGLYLAYQDPLALGVISLQAGLLLWSLPRAKGQGWLTAVIMCLLCLVLVALKLRLGRMEGPSLAMPLGLSFMTFRMLHLLVDSYSGRLESCPPADILAYLFFLPTLVVGPIHRLPEFQVDLRRRRFDPVLLGAGLERILHGYAKLVILRNLILDPLVLPLLARQANGTFCGDLLAAPGHWLDLYVTFSGASDLAVGYALAMGFRIQENFNSPFLATSIPDFWQRWHMSLTHWCRDYVFAPVAALSRSTWLGIVGAMLVIGLWHEVSFVYVLWALYHAAGILMWHRLSGSLGPRLPGGLWGSWLLRPLATLATLGFVLASFPVANRMGRILQAHVNPQK